MAENTYQELERQLWELQEQNHERTKEIAVLEEKMNTSYERLWADMAKRDKDNQRWMIGLWVAAIVILGVIIRLPSVPTIAN